MLKIVKKMKKLSILAFCIAIAFAGASSAMASTVTIANSLSGLVYYDGEYSGKIGATLDKTATSNGTPISGGMACVDISKTSFTGATIEVNISKLQPADMTNARFGSENTAILNYEKSAWLLGQMYLTSNSAQIGEIQFAIWRLFDPGYAFQANTDRKKDIEDDWLGKAADALINPQNFDFSSVRIYTPINITGLSNDSNASNQEFMSGTVISSSHTSGNQAPIPASFVLLASGLLGLGLLSRRKKAAVQVPGKDS